MTLAEFIQTGILVAWLAASVAAILRLKVFQPSSLLNAPPRHSLITVFVAGGVFLLYIGFTITILTLVSAVARHTPGSASSPTTAITTSSPAMTAATAPASTASAPASTSLSATAPAPSISDNLIEQSVDVLAKLLFCTGLALLATRLVRGGLRGWGLHWTQLPRGVAYGIAGFFIICPILLLADGATEMILEHFHRSISVHETLQLIAEPQITLGEKAFFMFVAGIAAPIGEEMFFRGVVQTALIQPLYGWDFANAPAPDFRPPPRQRWIAILTTSAIFAGIHLTPDHIPILFLLSLALGYVYERTGNLWGAISLHAAFNLTVLALNATAGP